MVILLCVGAGVLTSCSSFSSAGSPGSIDCRNLNAACLPPFQPPPPPTSVPTDPSCATQYISGIVGKTAGHLGVIAVEKGYSQPNEFELVISVLAQLYGACLSGVWQNYYGTNGPPETLEVYFPNPPNHALIAQVAQYLEAQVNIVAKVTVIR